MNEIIFLQSAVRQFRDYKLLAEKTFVQINDAGFHYQPNENTNSIAINITHLHGNMLSRWTNFLAEDGEKEWRQRDDEFETHPYSKEKLLQFWEEGWQILFNALGSINAEDLEKTIYIRSKPLTVIEAIHRQLTHYAYHTGQIVMMGKIIKGEEWQTLSIAKGQSGSYNSAMGKNNRI
ncbi:MAG: DUF1572 family protein [Chitinophagaceae bacterium]